jgi:hypothetical protein
MNKFYLRIRDLSVAVVLSAALGLSGISAARADTVLYSASGFVQGQESFTQAFNVTAPGYLTVTLSNIPWLDTIADMNVFFTTNSGALGTPMGAGTESISVNPGMVYAHWYGDADGLYGMGVYGLNISFSTLPSTVPVPLPTSLLLLLSALGFVLGWQRSLGPKLRGVTT